MCPTYGAASPASLPPTRKTVLPQKRQLFPRRDFQGTSTSTPSWRLTNWEGPHTLSLLCPSLLFPSVAGWRSKAGPDRVIYILMTGLERTECWNFRQPPVVLEILSFDTRLT